MLTDTNDIPAEVRPLLMRLRPEFVGNTPGSDVLDVWHWDEGQWDWEISMRDTQEDIDFGYIALVPTQNRERFRHRVPPVASHREWVIRFVGSWSWHYGEYLAKPKYCPDILVRKSLPEVKRLLDDLLGYDMPEIPCA